MGGADGAARSRTLCSRGPMKFTELGLRGAFVIELEPVNDERGSFTRTWSRREFQERGLNPAFEQCSTSFNHRAGTLRGMHYQTAPYAAAKLVRCTRGAVFDVIIDLRPSSATFKRWFATELREDNDRMIYAPEGFAHGFLTLADNSEIFYQIAAPYSKEHERGVRWNDPVFAIEWPAEIRIISERDRSYPNFAPA